MTVPQYTIAVAGIDTDAGKSVVTGLLARHLLDQGKAVTTLKLVQTGCSGTAEDIVQHRRLMGQALTDWDRDGTTCPYVFPFPASPLLAARMAGAVIDTAVLDRSIETLRQRHEWLLVEAAGGLLVPLQEHLLLLDYLAAKQLPLILVTSPRLGSINHTRLSLEALRTRSVPLVGLVYNLHGDHPREIVQDTLTECRKALADYGFAPNLVILPDLAESSAAAWPVLVQAARDLCT